MSSGYEFNRDEAEARVRMVLQPQPVPCDLGLWSLIVSMARDIQHLLKKVPSE